MKETGNVHAYKQCHSDINVLIVPLTKPVKGTKPTLHCNQSFPLFVFNMSVHNPGLFYFSGQIPSGVYDAWISYVAPARLYLIYCNGWKAKPNNAAYLLESEGRDYLTPANNRWLIKKVLNSKWAAKRGNATRETIGIWQEKPSETKVCLLFSFPPRH